MSEQKKQALERLRELRAEYLAAIGDGPAYKAPGFAEDANVTRKSYRLVAVDALESGVLSADDLEAAGLPRALEQTE